jgi:adenosylcobinamide-phosphate synthase
MLTIVITIVLAVAIDHLLGEPRRWHPLVGFGHFANRVEAILNHGEKDPRYVIGVIAWSIVAGTAFIAAIVLQILLNKMPWLLTTIGEALVLYLAIGRKSLIDHARAVVEALSINDLPKARYAVSMIVTRDTRALDESGVSKAAVETVLENGSDAIFASLFWFVVAGVPGVVLHRAANTLDAMWGYRNARFNEFGWAAARIDDGLNWIPARLTAFSYALAGQFGNALRSWREQAPQWSSPNAGPVMAAGAGALGLQLGGAAIYHGAEEVRPALGFGRSAQAGDIWRALALLDRSLLIWLGVLLFLVLLGSLL